MMNLIDKYFTGYIEDELIKYETHCTQKLPNGEVDMYAHDLNRGLKSLNLLTITECIIEENLRCTTTVRNLVSNVGEILLQHDNINVIRISNNIVLTDYGIYKLRVNSSIVKLSEYVPTGVNLVDVEGKIFESNSCFKTIRALDDYLLILDGQSLTVYDTSFYNPTSSTIKLDTVAILQISKFDENDDSFVIGVRSCQEGGKDRKFLLNKHQHKVSTT
jgi:hypothetical protein